MTRTAAQISSMRETALIALKPVGFSIGPDGRTAPPIVFSPETLFFPLFDSVARRGSCVHESGAIVDVELASAGSILRGIGAHAVSAGTSSRAVTVTSH